MFNAYGQEKKEVVLSTDLTDSIHTPKKATIRSAILPGLGQIYNNKHKPQDKKSTLWWKLPIVYGGIGASIYFTTVNHKEYKLFLNERTARLNADYVPQFYPEYDSEFLYPVQETYRKYRDYAVIGGLLVYVLNLIDANVEGHLMHFDAGDKLSLTILPNYNLSNATSQYGLKVGITFK